MNNNELTISKEMHNIENAKSKYFIKGLIISLIPYLLILYLADSFKMPNIYIYTIIGFTIISCIINALLLSSSVYKKLILFMNFLSKVDIQEVWLYLKTRLLI